MYEEETEGFERIIELLENEESELNSLISKIQNKINDLIEIEEPVSEQTYNVLYGLVLQSSRTLDQQYDHGLQLRNKATKYMRTVQKARKIVDILTLKMNENRLAFGLKGLIKKQIEGRKNIVPQTEEQIHALEQDYARTPYNPMTSSKKIRSTPRKGGNRRSIKIYK
jgi:hypothetical protein